MAIGAPFSVAARAEQTVRLFPQEVAQVVPVLRQAITQITPDRAANMLRSQHSFVSHRYGFWQAAEDAPSLRPPVAMERLLRGIERGNREPWYVAYAAFGELQEYRSWCIPDETLLAGQCALERYAVALDCGAAPWWMNSAPEREADLRPLNHDLPVDLTVTDEYADESFFTGRLLVPQALWEGACHTFECDVNGGIIPLFLSARREPAGEEATAYGGALIHGRDVVVNFDLPVPNAGLGLLRITQSQRCFEGGWVASRVRACLAGLQLHLGLMAETITTARSTWTTDTVTALTEADRRPQWLRHKCDEYVRRQDADAAEEMSRFFGRRYSDNSGPELD